MTEGRLMTEDRLATEDRLMTRWGDTLADLGWDPGWAATFAPFAANWRQPARVVAAYRDGWTVATPAGDRDAVIAGRLRHAAIMPVDLPAVGDWVVADVGADVGGPNDCGPAVIRSILPRRTVFQRARKAAMPSTIRSWPPTWMSRS